MVESHQSSDGFGRHPLQISGGKEEKRKGWSSHALTTLLLLMLAAAPPAAADGDGVAITLADYQGLQAFRHALGDPRGILRSWNDTGLGACSGAWLGIKCVKGKVIAIQLPWRGLGGRISEKVGQLTALRKLSLHDNFIGGQIPPAIGFITELRGLHLFNNRFSGAIPPEIGRCPLLQTIDLSNNLLTGGIPSSLSNSTKLLRLNFSYNNLSGSIPVSVSRLLSLKALILSNNRLDGSIPSELGGLRSLQTLDLSNNSIGGSFPTTISNLSSLVLLDLERNQLGGQIPDSIDGLKNLSVFSVKYNRLGGEIPARLGNVTTLSQLDLSDNNFTGEILASLTRLSSLTFFNVSDNNLSGKVPVLLSQRFNSSSFRGNVQLCGYRGSVPCPSSPATNPPPPPPSRRHRRLSTKDIILIACGGVLLLLLLLCCILLCCLVRKRSTLSQKSRTTGAAAAAAASGRGEKPGPAGGDEAEAGGEVGGKLVHFDGGFVFTADDLLCATAEIMGKSTYGTVYKATLDDGNQVAVKRLREKTAKGQKEFETEVNILGKIRHPNLLALRAYYLGPKGEKLLVFDFMPKGSLAAYLHARGPETPVDWPTRMRIAMGGARGLSYLHNDMTMIHGNLTSSNILLDDALNAKIADFSLSRLMTAAANSNVIATAGALGYRAPELSKLKKANPKTDVYSLGVVILELLTGKSPGESMNGMDLPQWVASIVKEEWTNEVFDLELMKDASAAGTTGDELLNSLKLALHCVDPSPTARPDAQQVLRQLEEIKPELAGVASAGGSAEEGGPPPPPPPAAEAAATAGSTSTD